MAIIVNSEENLWKTNIYSSTLEKVAALGISVEFLDLIAADPKRCVGVKRNDYYVLDLQKGVRSNHPGSNNYNSLREAGLRRGFGSLMINFNNEQVTKDN